MPAKGEYEMIGENFKRLNRNTQTKELQNKIYDLQNQCGNLMRISKNTESHLPEKYYEILKEIEWNEYLLWGSKNNIY